MKGALFFSTRYGSTAQYAEWVAQETGLPTHDIRSTRALPMDYDFLILMSPIIYYKLDFRRWLRRHRVEIMSKPAVLVTVSGAPPGGKLDAWLDDCVAPEMRAHMEHIALGGRQDPAALGWYDRMMLLIAARRNRDKQAAREEREGFDHMDKASIAPLVDRIRALQAQDLRVSRERAGGRPMPARKPALAH